jgi:hypothetical protein
MFNSPGMCAKLKCIIKTIKFSKSKKKKLVKVEFLTKRPKKK